MILAEVLAKSGEAAKSGPIGLAVILILCIVCYFLFKSMSKHLRNVRERFPAETNPDESAAEQSAVSVEKRDGTTDQPGSEPPAT